MVPRTLENAALWEAVRSSHGAKLHPPASAARLDVFEQTIGVRLPPSYRSFLLYGNGGSVGSVRIFGVLGRGELDLAQKASLLKRMIEPTAPGPVLAFANDWGGGVFCFDLRYNGSDLEYPVVYWNHEYAETPEFSSKLWSSYAADFTEFVKKAVG